MAKYKGSVTLISGLTQANNGTFPLIDASAVQVDDNDTRLDAKLKELGNKASSAKFNVTIEASKFPEGKTSKQTISVPGIKATDNVIIGLIQSDNNDTAELELEAYSFIRRVTYADNSITVYCYDDIPTIDIKVQIVVIR